MGRPRVGVLRLASRRTVGTVHFREWLEESVAAADDVYEPLTKAVFRYRELVEQRTGWLPTEEDEAMMEVAMGIMRRLYFWKTKMREILESAE